MGQHNRQPEYEVRIPSVDDAVRHIQAQIRSGAVSRSVGEDAIRQVTRVTNVTYPNKAAAERVARNIKGATVGTANGYSEQKGCALWLIACILVALVIIDCIS